MERVRRAAYEDPAPLLMTLDQPGLGEEADVAAHARLALAQKLGQVFDVEFAAEKKAQYA